MSLSCGECKSPFATRQSLSKHRKRKHPEETIKEKNDKVELANDIVNDILKGPPIGIVNGKKSDNNSLKIEDFKPRIKRIKKVTKEPVVIQKVNKSKEPVLSPKIKQEIVNSILKPKSLIKLATEKEEIESEPESESESESESSESESKESEESESETDVPVFVKPEPKDENEQEVTDERLIESFKKLYSNFDEDDIEVYNDLLTLLDILKQKGCITDNEYLSVKSRLKEKVHLNLYESINSTADNMTRDDKTQILGLLRAMKNDEAVKKVLDSVKQYFEGEKELETVLNALPRLKDKLNTLRVKIILNQVGRTKDRVEKVFTKLINAEEKGVALSFLRAEDLITDEQFEKLSIAPNTLPSISKIVQGKGFWLY